MESDLRERVERLEMWLDELDRRPAVPGRLGLTLPPTTRLAYAPGSDLLNGTAIAATTWTDVSANQSFTVGSATVWLLVEVRAKVLATAAAVAGLGLRAVFNSAGTPISVVLGGGVVTPAGGWGSVHGQTFYLAPGALPRGTNTLKVQFYSEVACTAYCRGSSAPNVEPFALVVVELGA